MLIIWCAVIRQKPNMYMYTDIRVAVVNQYNEGSLALVIGSRIHHYLQDFLVKGQSASPKHLNEISKGNYIDFSNLLRLIYLSCSSNLCDLRSHNYIVFVFFSSIDFG